MFTCQVTTSFLSHFNVFSFTTISHLSLSPSHFDTRSDDDTEMNVELFASVATAFARYDLPVPGGYGTKQTSRFIARLVELITLYMYA